MKDQRRTEIKVGITVITGLLIFLWIFGWAKNFSLTPAERTLKVKFDSVAGLEIGDNVTVNGVRKGIVEDFLIEGENVIVSLSISNDIVLKKDASFAVSMLDLMGGKKIDINPGSAGEELDYNQVQSGIFYADIPSVMSMVGTVQDDLYAAIKDVKIILSTLNDYLTDKKLNNDVRNSISNLNEMTGKLNLMIDENRDNLKQVTSSSARFTEKANNFLDRNEEGINESINEFKSVLERSDSLLLKLNSFADEMRNRENTLGKVLYDEKFYNDLSGSLSRLNELTKLILQQLQEDGFKVDVNLF